MPVVEVHSWLVLEGYLGVLVCCRVMMGVRILDVN